MAHSKYFYSERILFAFDPHIMYLFIVQYLMKSGMGLIVIWFGLSVITVLIVIFLTLNLNSMLIYDLRRLSPSLF